LAKPFFDLSDEVERAIRWREKGNAHYSHMAFERALELLDLTVADEKNKKRLKELLRLRETLADYFAFENVYQSSDRSFQNYFYAFTFAARKGL